MSEFYEFAKQFDVIVIFAVLYGIGLGGIVYWIMESLHWCWKKLKQHWEKKHKMKNSLKNNHNGGWQAQIPAAFIS